ncbi:ATP-binding protein [Streptomyces eurocidicus]|uniref:Anti-sigma regulatory factor (Ser/Thr protein kinase) n=2 Tax=Streptomyces eurocidicus TaxID=66423 RepID=A0A7W8BKE1_STREU|nr:anti-sigma regulatory factor (Ser/Thr protein kinase) [Streptomyces eurocidicus]
MHAVRAARCESPGRWEELGSREFPGLPQSVREARRFVANLCATVGYPLEPVDLLISEVATNALIHGGGGFAVRCFRMKDRFRVEVDDRSYRIPYLRHPGADEVHGRGVRLLDKLAEWGAVLRKGGKTVYFEPREGPWGA